MIESTEDRINRVLPNTSPVLSLRIQGSIHYQHPGATTLLPAYTLSGLRKTPRLIQYEAGTVNLLIFFRAGGITAFFKTPAHALFNESVSLDYLVQQDALALLEDQLGYAENNNARIAAAEGFLLQQLAGQPPAADSLVMAALQQIQQHQGNLSIRQLAASLYTSPDAFEKHFRKIVGTTPKQFASLIRMKSVTQHRSQLTGFTSLALDAGYFDQSHFNKAFKQFTGLTPSDFFQQPRQW
jgi:AraC-like DNA-binding protein